MEGSGELTTVGEAEACVDADAEGEREVDAETDADAEGERDVDADADAETEGRREGEAEKEAEAEGEAATEGRREDEAEAEGETATEAEGEAEGEAERAGEGEHCGMCTSPLPVPVSDWATTLPSSWPLLIVTAEKGASRLPARPKLVKRTVGDEQMTNVTRPCVTPLRKIWNPPTLS